MSVQMQTGSLRSFSQTLPPPSGASVTVTNGIAAVNEADVRIAMLLSWTVMAGQVWPASELVRMNAPPSFAGISTLTLPNGSTVSVTSGLAAIPIGFVDWAASLGWSAA